MIGLSNKYTLFIFSVRNISSHAKVMESEIYIKDFFCFRVTMLAKLNPPNFLTYIHKDYFSLTVILWGTTKSEDSLARETFTQKPV